MTTDDALKACPSCGKEVGELQKSDVRFPYHVKCNACGFVTDFVSLPGVAVKLWNEAKPARTRRRAKR